MARILQQDIIEILKISTRGKRSGREDRKSLACDLDCISILCSEILKGDVKGGKSVQ